jgi:hypothetical protein
MILRLHWKLLHRSPYSSAKRARSSCQSQGIMLLSEDHEIIALGLSWEEGLGWMWPSPT